MNVMGWMMYVPSMGACARLLALSLPIAFSGCLAVKPYESVGEFKAPGRKEHVGDVIYGFTTNDDSCCIIQYRLTEDKVLQGKDFHNDFFATNFTCDCRLLHLLETNLVLFAKREKSIVVVKGAFFNPVTRIIRKDRSGRRAPEFYFAAVYDETPPEKAIGFLLPAEQNYYFPLPKNAYQLIEVERLGGIEVFGKIKDRERIRTTFSEDQWWRRRRRRVKTSGHRTVQAGSEAGTLGLPAQTTDSSNSIDGRAPATGISVVTITGNGGKVLTEEVVRHVDTNKCIKINEKVPEYSKDGRIKYDKGRAFYEQKYYEAAPDEGLYWMCLDGEYIRVHKPGCRKFEKGRGRHCKLTEESGQFGLCCGGRMCIVELLEQQARERKKNESARGAENNLCPNPGKIGAPQP